MKKIFTYTAIAAICLAGNTSCSSDETINEVAKAQETTSQSINNAALLEIRSDIAKLNLEEYGEMPQETRSLKSFFRKLWKIVAADALGGIAGASGGPLGMAIGAATASGTAAVPVINKKLWLVTTLIQLFPHNTA